MLNLHQEKGYAYAIDDAYNRGCIARWICSDEY